MGLWNLEEGEEVETVSKCLEREDDVMFQCLSGDCFQISMFTKKAATASKLLIARLEGRNELRLRLTSGLNWTSSKLSVRWERLPGGEITCQYCCRLVSGWW